MMPAEAVALLPLIDVVFVLPGEVTEPVALTSVISSPRVAVTDPGEAVALSPEICLVVFAPRLLTEPEAGTAESATAALGNT
jgi:hypothetical protein